uniref:non-specific serine/threonine protein kinase n=1 Tax=Corethron hystrix TaxID=216773 RepID=A0A6U5LPY7_9STRA
MAGAASIALAVSDLQNVDGLDRPTIIHRDISLVNYVIVKGRMKLNDFNGSYMIKWDKERDQPCNIRDHQFCGYDGRRVDARSPEECLDNPLSAKLDVYGLGFVLFNLLTGKRPYHLEPGNKTLTNDDYRQLIVNDIPPSLSNKIEDSKDSATIAVKTAIRMAMTHFPQERPTAKAIADYLITSYVEARGGKI